MEIYEADGYWCVRFSHTYRKRQQGALWRECVEALKNSLECAYQADRERWVFDLDDMTKEKLEAIKRIYV